MKHRSKAIIIARQVEEIFSARIALRKSKEQLHRACIPPINDMTLLPSAAEMCKRYFREDKSCHVRKKILCALLLLFCPSSLAEGRMSNGMRAQLCAALDISSPSSLSNDKSYLFFYLTHYSDFMEEVEGAVNYVLSSLKVRS